MVEVTLLTVGASASMTIALLAPNEFAAPGEARVNLAAVPPVVALIVPLFSANAVVPVQSRSLLLSPACTV